jgi:hypothetical protein
MNPLAPLILLSAEDSCQFIGPFLPRLGALAMFASNVVADLGGESGSALHVEDSQGQSQNGLAIDARASQAAVVDSFWEACFA